MEYERYFILIRTLTQKNIPFNGQILGIMRNQVKANSLMSES